MGYKLRRPATTAPVFAAERLCYECWKRGTASAVVLGTGILLEREREMHVKGERGWVKRHGARTAPRGNGVGEGNDRGVGGALSVRVLVLQLTRE